MVIEKQLFSNTEELLPVISFNAKGSVEERRRHENLVKRTVVKGYAKAGPAAVRLELCVRK